LRKRTNLKAYEMAEKMGLSAATLSRYENGKAPVPKTVALAARYLCEQETGPVLDTPETRLAEAVREVAAWPASAAQ
jgi:transcriptional regulator with XRE-family HTH domain